MHAGSILAFVGYDPVITEGMPAATVRKLAVVEWVRLGVVFLVAIAISYSVFASLVDSGPVRVWSWTLGCATFVLLLALQRLSVCLTGPGLIRGAAVLGDWQPQPYRVLLMLVVGIIVAQPGLLAVFRSTADDLMAQRMKDVVRLQLDRQQQMLVRGDAALRLRRAQLSERLATVTTADINRRESAAAISVGPAQVVLPKRKAIVVAARRYQHAPPLENPARDAAAMAAKLASMGFEVTTSVDEPGELVQVRLSRYFEALRPGDISVVFYAGHGYQQDGHNYLVPIDFEPQARRNAIRITRFLEAADRQSPQLQVIMLDACRTFESDGFRPANGGLAELQGGSNSFIAMAAKPGNEALDGPPGTNGVFTAAILRHIARAEDINVLFRRISADVRNAARMQSFEQQPVVTSTLSTEYVQLVDPRISPPESPFEIAAVTLPEVIAPEKRANPTPDCPVPQGVSEADQRAQVAACLSAKITAIDRVLNEWQFVGRLTLRGDARAHQQALMQSGLFTEKLRSLWISSPYLMLTLTTLFALVVAAGEGVHFFFRDAVAAYVRRRHRGTVNALQANHDRVMAEVERLLGDSRHPDYRSLQRFRTRFEWFGADVARPGWAGIVRSVPPEQQRLFESWLQVQSPPAVQQRV